MDQTTINGMEEKKYLDNIQAVYDANNKSVETMATPVVPASKKLEDNGISLYVDEDGVLKCKPTRYAKPVAKYLESRGLVVKENEKHSTALDMMAGFAKEF